LLLQVKPHDPQLASLVKATSQPFESMPSQLPRRLLQTMAL